MQWSVLFRWKPVVSSVCRDSVSCIIESLFRFAAGLRMDYASINPINALSLFVQIRTVTSRSNCIHFQVILCILLRLKSWGMLRYGFVQQSFLCRNGLGPGTEVCLNRPEIRAFALLRLRNSDGAKDVACARYIFRELLKFVICRKLVVCMCGLVSMRTSSMRAGLKNYANAILQAWSGSWAEMLVSGCMPSLP